jgi:hypothetical protein
MIVKSLLSRVTGLMRKGVSSDEILSMMKEEGYDEAEIKKTIDFVKETTDFVEEVVEFVEKDHKHGKIKVSIEEEMPSKKKRERLRVDIAEEAPKEKKRKKKKAKTAKKKSRKKKLSDDKKALVKEAARLRREAEKEETKEEPVEEKKIEAKKIEKIKEEAVKVHGKLIETQIDKLYKKVNELGKVKISKAAAMLKVKPKTVEEWGKMLEANDMIEIRYHTFGATELVKKKEGKK